MLQSLLLLLVLLIASTASGHIDGDKSHQPEDKNATTAALKAMELLKATFAVNELQEELFNSIAQPIFAEVLATSQPQKGAIATLKEKNHQQNVFPLSLGEEHHRTPREVFERDADLNMYQQRQRRAATASSATFGSFPTSSDLGIVEIPDHQCFFSDFARNIACNISMVAQNQSIGIIIDQDDIEDQLDVVFQHVNSISTQSNVVDLYVQVDIDNWEYLLDWLLGNVQWDFVTSITIVGNLGGSLQNAMFETFTQLLYINIKINGVQLSADTFAGPSRQTIQVLDISGNNILALPAGIFSGLTSLHTLYLNDNQIPVFSEGAFDDCPNLQTLWLFTNHVVQYPDNLFRNLTNLKSLSVRNNQLERIPRVLFSNLPALELLDLGKNHIEAIDDEAFEGLPNLKVLALSNNLLENLPGSGRMLEGTPSLEEFWIDQNFLRDIPATTLLGLSKLSGLVFRSNQLTSLAPTLFDDLTSLTRLWLQENNIKYLSDTVFNALTMLQDLRLDENNIQSITPSLLSPLLNLQNIALDGNDLQSLDSSSFEPLQKLQIVDLSDNTDLVISTAIFFPLVHLRKIYLENMKSIILAPLPLNLTDLTHLGVDSTVIIGNITQAFGLLPKLQYLTLGFIELNEDGLPFQRICNALATDVPVELLSISGTSYRSLNLCQDSTISSVYLRNNKELVSLLSYRHGRVDVSGCSSLTTFDVISSDILDISGTNLPFSTRYCQQLGSLIMFARDLRHVSFQNKLNVRHLLLSCFRFGQVFDFSNNDWLSDLSLIQEVASNNVVLGNFTRKQQTDLFFTDSGERATSRVQLPFVVLDGTAISCSVNIFVLQVSSNELSTSFPFPSFRFECGCSVGYEKKGNNCVSTALSSGDIAGIAIGSTLVVLSVVLVVVYFRFKRKDQEQNKLRREKEIQDIEVEALKKVWQVNLQELELDRKVDEGAFGEVWKAHWDGVTVAVKFMKNSGSHGYGNEIRLQEFDKELDFLRRTRHPHLVRFFGTGIDSHGSPFIVLEFVELGSLKNILLHKGLGNAVLQLQSQHGAKSVERLHLSIPELKFMLVQDVARGMEFLHSLNTLHRDLKTGNVLVNNKLIAKISDFGSMSRRLNKLASTPSQNNFYSRNNSFLDETDFTEVSSLLYSPESITRTLATTMTAGVGTPLYMAPEVLDLSQVRMQKLSPKCDVFSFGILMWEVWMCKVPDLIDQELGGSFRGPISSALFGLYQQGKRLTYAENDDGQLPPPWYAELSLQCMALSPQERPSFTNIVTNDGFLPTA